MLVLKPNTYYKTRDGRKAFVGFIHPHQQNAWPCHGYIEGELQARIWERGGRYIHGLDSLVDLVSEWTEPAVGSSAWALSLPVGTKIRWMDWKAGCWLRRTGSGWEMFGGMLRIPGDNCSENGWLLYTEPKLRPWRHDEVPLGAWFTLEGKAGRYLITGATEVDLVVAGLGGIGYECALNRGKHSTDNGKTWLPCGVKE